MHLHLWKNMTEGSVVNCCHIAKCDVLGHFYSLDRPHTSHPILTCFGEPGRPTVISSLGRCHTVMSARNCWPLLTMSSKPQVRSHVLCHGWIPQIFAMLIQVSWLFIGEILRWYLCPAFDCAGESKYLQPSPQYNWEWSNYLQYKSNSWDGPISTLSHNLRAKSHLALVIQPAPKLWSTSQAKYLP